METSNSCRTRTFSRSWKLRGSATNVPNKSILDDACHQQRAVRGGFGDCWLATRRRSSPRLVPGHERSAAGSRRLLLPSTGSGCVATQARRLQDVPGACTAACPGTYRTVSTYSAAPASGISVITCQGVNISQRIFMLILIALFIIYLLSFYLCVI